MRINKLRAISISIFCLFVALFSGAQCQDIIEGELYQIKSKCDKICLNYTEKKWGIPYGISGNAIGMESCILPEHEIFPSSTSKPFWSFQKAGVLNGFPYYRIINKHGESYLDNWSRDLSGQFGGPGCVGLNPQVKDKGQFWYLKKNHQGYYYIKNKDTGLCLENFGFGAPSDYGSSGVAHCSDKAPNHSWHLVKEKDDSIPTKSFTSSGYELFSSSFLSGVSYTLIPEIIRDILESRGHPDAANITAMIIQYGMIFHNTSPVPIITGLATRKLFSQLGFSNQTSAVAGSTAAVVTNVYQNLIFSQETAFDCITDCAISFAGSCAGSVLALQAKSWVYGVFYKGNSSKKDKLILDIKNHFS